MRRRITDEELDELVKCKNDCVYFAKTYGWTRHTTRGAIRWDHPYPYQEELWTALQNEESVIVNKTRQIGCSWAIALFSVWLMIFHPDVEILFLSETEKKAVRLLDNAKFVFDRLPIFLKPEVTQRSQTRFEVSFITHVSGNPVISRSSIDSLTTTKRAGASYSPKFAVMDEAAHLANGEELFGALIPATTHGGFLAVVSTPGGMDNFFYRVWYEANTIENYRFRPVVAYWRDCGFDDEWFERVTSSLTVQQKLQEYEMRFLPSGSPFFDIEQLAAVYRPKKEYPILEDTTGARIDQRTKITFTGVDTAGGMKLKGGGKPDYTSIVSLNEYGVEIDSWHSQDTRLEEVAGYIATMEDGKHVFVEGKVTKWHRDHPGIMVIERWGPGDAVYMNHYMNAPNDDISHVIGRRTTGGLNATASKTRMLNALRLAIAGRQIIIRDPFTYYCLQTFTDKGGGKYEATEGAYDDPVIALALAYSELNRYGGLILDIKDDVVGGPRMIATIEKDDRPIDDIDEVLSVGQLMQGPIFDSSAGDLWEERRESV